MFQFLADYRDQRLREAIGDWVGGTLTERVESESRGRALLANELLALEWDHLLQFYGLSEDVLEAERQNRASR